MLNMTDRVKNYTFLLFVTAMLSSLLLLTGCIDKAMSRTDMITAAAQCETAGYKAYIYKSQWDGRVLDVRCLPVKSGGE